MPYDVEAKIDPIYSSHKGWCRNIAGIKQFEQLPQQMKDYVHTIEEKLNLPVAIVSTSPDREDTIIKSEF